jgi:hypothetical protein
MHPSTLTKYRQQNPDNRLVLYLLSEIEILTNTNKLLNSRIETLKELTNVRKPRLSRVHVPRVYADAGPATENIANDRDAVFQRENA